MSKIIQKIMLTALSVSILLGSFGSITHARPNDVTFLKEKILQKISKSTIDNEKLEQSVANLLKKDKKSDNPHSALSL